ncbi:MAG: hypothetical protein AAF490_19830, partial [Chloroflexota bacterium]
RSPFLALEIVICTNVFCCCFLENDKAIVLVARNSNTSIEKKDAIIFYSNGIYHSAMHMLSTMAAGFGSGALPLGKYNI